MTQQKVSTNEYCYNEVMKKICIGHTEAFAKGADANMVFTNWSPNNIRRIVISSIGFSVKYYVTQGMSNRRLDETFLFNPQQAEACMQSPDYVPMIKALVGHRRCTGIEEIVILVGCNPRYELPATELDFSLLLDKGQGVNAEQLSRKFPRLAMINVIQGLPFSHNIEPVAKEMGKLFAAQIKKNMGDKVKFVQTYSINKDYDTHKPTFTSANIYVPDRKGVGQLNNFFENYFEEREKQRASSRVDALNTEKKNKEKEALRNKMRDTWERVNISVGVLESLVGMKDYIGSGDVLFSGVANNGLKYLEAISANSREVNQSITAIRSMLGKSDLEDLYCDNTTKYTKSYINAILENGSKFKSEDIDKLVSELSKFAVNIFYYCTNKFWTIINEYVSKDYGNLILAVKYMGNITFPKMPDVEFCNIPECANFRVADASVTPANMCKAIAIYQYVEGYMRQTMRYSVGELENRVRGFVGLEAKEVKKEPKVKEMSKETKYALDMFNLGCGALYTICTTCNSRGMSKLTQDSLGISIDSNPYSLAIKLYHEELQVPFPNLESLHNAGIKYDDIDGTCKFFMKTLQEATGSDMLKPVAEVNDLVLNYGVSLYNKSIDILTSSICNCYEKHTVYANRVFGKCDLKHIRELQGRDVLIRMDFDTLAKILPQSIVITEEISENISDLSYVYSQLLKIFISLFTTNTSTYRNETVDTLNDRVLKYLNK